MSDSLKRFTKEIQEIIVEWGKVSPYTEDEYDSDETEEDPPLNATLMIINWNEAGLQERQIKKAVIINMIQEFIGCQPFPAYTQPQSDSIFTITAIHHYQMALNIIGNLRKTYYRYNQNIPVRTLGKVYTISGTRDGEFDAVEHYNTLDF